MSSGWCHCHWSRDHSASRRDLVFWVKWHDNRSQADPRSSPSSFAICVTLNESLLSGRLGSLTPHERKMVDPSGQQCPTFLAAGTGFKEDNFSTDWRGVGDGFGVIQAHCIYRALCFYHYYIRLHSDYQALHREQHSWEMTSQTCLLPKIWSLILSVRPKTLQEIELNWSKTSCKRIAEHFCVAFIIRKKKNIPIILAIAISFAF